LFLQSCLSDPRNQTGAVPTTVTELYQLAKTYFDKHHNRKLTGQSSEEAIKKLQLLAYDGIESSNWFSMKNDLMKK
jgi:hypothetical protein